MNIVDIRHRTPKRVSKRNLSSVTHIVRHHSATTAGDFDSFWNNRWRGLGWSTGGYHEIILTDGTVQLCYDPDVVTNGVGNNNSYTYHICVVGNGQFTEAQERAFDERCRLAMARLNIPVSRVKGHNEMPGASTACPGINMNTVRSRLTTISAQGVVDVNKPSEWAKSSWEKAIKKGVMNEGQGPKDPLTREQLAVVLDRMGMLD